MIVYKKWKTLDHSGPGLTREVYWDGWYLFGVVALYVRQRSDAK